VWFLDMRTAFSLVRRIEFSETDMAGIVHFSNFFRMMEMAEHAFLRELGTSVHVRGSGGVIGWPRVKVECEYARPLHFEDEVEIRLSVEEVRRRSVRYGFEFLRLPGAEHVARGRVVAVCVRVDGEGGLEAVEIPPEVRRGLLACSSGEGESGD